MARDLTGTEWASLLTTFDRTARRLECQGEYHEPYETEPFQHWLAGQPSDLSYMDEWLAGVRAATAAGRHYQRIRVLTDPLTPYLRWEMDVARINAAAGEDIRVLDAVTAAELLVGDEDFWLLDDQVAAVMHFGPEFLGATSYDLSDPADATAVEIYRDIWNRAWPQARPFADHPALRSV